VWRGEKRVLPTGSGEVKIVEMEVEEVSAVRNWAIGRENGESAV
jgi:hypothetical protein